MQPHQQLQQMLLELQIRVLFNNNTNTTTTSANLTFNGTQLNVTNNIRANNLRLGLTNGTTIDTVSGDLVLDSSNNKVHITANAEVDGSLTIDIIQTHQVKIQVHLL